MNDIKFHAPCDLKDALEMMAQLPNVSVIAGGTDLVPRMNRNREKTGLSFPGYGGFGLPEKNIVSIGSWLSYVRELEDKLVIGAGTTISELLSSEIFCSAAPVLAESLRMMAGLTIRNTATIGGNICNASPAGDSLPALYVLGAKVAAASVRGERTLAIEKYILGPGRTAIERDEILKEIILPKQVSPGAFIKMGRRKTETLSVINAACILPVENCRVGASVKIAIGACGPAVIRLKVAENIVAGNNMSESLAEEAGKAAAREVSPIDDVRSSAWYRKQMAEVITKRVLNKAWQRSGSEA